MDDSQSRRAMKSLNKSKDHGRVILSSSSDTQPEDLPANVNAEGLLQLLLSFRNSAPSVVTPGDLNVASMADEVAPRDIECQQNLHHPAPRTSIVPPASSVANGMLSLKQKLASLHEELQRRRALPPAPISLSGRALDINLQAAFLIEQQQGRWQGSLQATSSVLDRIPTIEQQLPSLTDEQQRRLGSYQASSSAQNRVSFSIEEQLASLIDQQQRYRASFQDRKPSIEQQLASLNGPASTSPASRLPSKRLAERHQTSPVTSLEQLQLLAQLQRDIVPHVQPEIQATVGRHSFGNVGQGHLVGPLQSGVPSNLLAEQHQTSHVTSLEQLQLLSQLQRGIVPHAQPKIRYPAGGYPFGNVDQSHPVGPFHSGVPPEGTIPVPPPYGPHEPFPGKLYRLLAEAESSDKENIVSFTPDGRAFKIHCRETFIKHVSPTYFRQAKITSFARQLNFYGFEKVLLGPNRGGFAHPYFLRGHPELLRKIERKEVAPRPKKSQSQSE
jgi:hypothetical protein